MLLFLVLALATAGCIGTQEAIEEDATEAPSASIDDLTEPIYEAIQRTEHVIQDTVHGEETNEIWMDVYRPENAEDPVPVILVFTPYQSLGDALGSLSALDGDVPIPPEESPYNPALVDFFTPRGYAVAFASVPGNHNSGGCIDQSGPDQWKDGYAVVEWLGTQEWSNGNVGMYGASYDGETQITTALLNPPSLKTIVPTASVDSQYKYLHYGGVPYELQGAGTMAAYLAISAIPGTRPNAALTYHERFTCQPENLERALDTTGDWHTYWEDRAYHKLAPESNVTMLRTHGFQDWNVKPDHIDPSTNEWGGETRAIYGQWGHAQPDRDDWWGHGDILHQWFDEHLHGIDTGIKDALPPVLFEDTQGQWYGVNDFPITDQEPVTFHLTHEGTLEEHVNEPGELIIHDYPRDAPGMSMGTTGPTVSTIGETLTDHPATLTFETTPFEEEFLITSRPTLNLTATTDQTSTHWVAHLEVVRTDGESEWINRGYLDATQRHGVETTEPLTPGEPYTFTLEMFPQADVIQPGDVLRLTLTNTDDWVHQDDSYATSTIETGPNATLALPGLSPNATMHDPDRLETIG